MRELFEDFNWLAVLVGAVGYFALGAIWYSFLFQKKWIAYNNINMDDPSNKKGVGAIMGISFLLMLVQSLAIGILAARIDLTSCWLSGVKLGAITGGCFGAMAVGVNYLYEKKPLGLFLINGGYALVGNIIAAVIICMWR
jgi:Protein of unknown function (DUF1761)